MEIGDMDLVAFDIVLQIHGRTQFSIMSIFMKYEMTKISNKKLSV